MLERKFVGKISPAEMVGRRNVFFLQKLTLISENRYLTSLWNSFTVTAAQNK